MRYYCTYVKGGPKVQVELAVVARGFGFGSPPANQDGLFKDEYLAVFPLGPLEPKVIPFLVASHRTGVEQESLPRDVAVEVLNPVAARLFFVHFAVYR